MMKGGHGQTNQLHDIYCGARDSCHWSALDHVSQLMSCNYYNYACMDTLHVCMDVHLLILHYRLRLSTTQA